MATDEKYMRNTSLAFRFFFEEDAVIAYDETSGDTHLLSIVAGEIFEALTASPASIEALKESLCSRFPEDAPELVNEGVDLALVQLLGADLIQAVADC